MQKDILLMGALGNCLGLPYEFDNRPFNLSTFNGHWDDDIAQSLMLAECYLEDGTIKPHRFYNKLLGWYNRGYDSLTDGPEGMGNQTYQMIKQYSENINFTPRKEDMSGKNMDGNGSLMRDGIFGMIDDNYQKLSQFQSMTTHNTDLCNYSCMFFSELLHVILENHDLDCKNMIKESFSNVDCKMIPKILSELISNKGYLKKIDRPSGFVLHTLHAVLNTFVNTHSAMEGFEYIINLGGDTDTTACIYGYLAGAYYGIDDNMKHLIKQIKDVSYINYLSRKIYERNS